MVTDFNVEAEQPAAFGEPGIYAAGATAALRRSSAWDLRTMITLDGVLWLAESLLGVPNPMFGSLAWATYGGVPLFILVFYSDEGVGVATSRDGSDWGNADYTLDISVGDAESLQVQVTGDETIHVYSSPDGTYRQYSVEYPSGPGGDAFIEQIGGIESVLPELNQVAVPRYPALEDLQAFEDEAEQARRVGTFLGDILFPYATGD